MKEKTKANIVLSIKFVSVISFLYVLFIYVLIYFIYKKSFLEKLEVTAFITTVSLFLFIFLCLYKGVYFKHDSVNKKFTFDKLGNANPVDFINLDIDFSSGIVGAIVSIILGVLITIALILLIEILWSVIFIVLFLAIYWITYKALKLIQRHSLKSRGNIAVSLKYGLIYSFLYSGWLVIVFYVSKSLYIRY